MTPDDPVSVYEKKTSMELSSYIHACIVLLNLKGVFCNDVQQKCISLNFDGSRVN